MSEEKIWKCNECNSTEYTGSISNKDLPSLSCSSCGCNEFHLEEINKPKSAIDELIAYYEESWNSIGASDMWKKAWELKNKHTSQPCFKPKSAEEILRNVFMEELSYVTEPHQERIIKAMREYASQPCSKCEEKDAKINKWKEIADADFDQLKANVENHEKELNTLESQLSEANKNCEEKNEELKNLIDQLDFCKQNHHTAEYVEREVTQGKPISEELKNAVKLYLEKVGEVYRKDLVQHDFCAGWMARESVNKISSEIIEKEIRRAFIHGQGNAEMMEAGLERNEVDDYVNFTMLSLGKQDKTENEKLREENLDLLDRLQATEDMRKMQQGNAEYWKKMYDEAVLALPKT